MQCAVIYARVSSREQEREGCSIPAQRKLLQEYARMRGFRVLHEFIDEESAKNPGRKEFGKMLPCCNPTRSAGLCWSRKPTVSIAIALTALLLRN